MLANIIILTIASTAGLLGRTGNPLKMVVDTAYAFGLITDNVKPFMKPRGSSVSTNAIRAPEVAIRKAKYNKYESDAKSRM